MADFETQFKCKDGRPVVIAIDDVPCKVTAYTLNGQEIGSMEFDEADSLSGNGLKLVWAHFDGLDGAYLHQGIGAQILKLVRERYRMPIFTEDNDGIPKADGSHLTGDAPAFVAKMRVEGLIEPSGQEDYDDPEGFD